MTDKLTLERFDAIKQSPRQATLEDIEDLCDEIELLRKELLNRTINPIYVLVPREPTPTMLRAFKKIEEWLKSNEGTGYLVQSALDNAMGEPYWKAMVAAYEAESHGFPLMETKP